jgi:hypothetical protein
MIYLYIAIGWLLSLFLILRFFCICKDTNRIVACDNMTWEEILEFDLFVSDEAIKFTGLDDCITGIDQRGFLIYQYEKIVEHFQDEDGMSYEEAVEYIDFNVIGIKPDNYTIHYSKP